MYLLILGDFGSLNLMRNEDDYLPEEKTWIGIENFLSHLYFLLATFVTQIMIFNMLISIMGNTQSRQLELVDETSKRQRLRIWKEFDEQMNSMSKLCCRCCSRQKADPHIDVGRYLVVIRPRHEYTEGGAQAQTQASGDLAEQGDEPAHNSKQSDEKFREIEAILNKKVLRQLIDMAADTGARLDTLERGSKELEDSIKRDTQNKINLLKQEVKDKIAAVDDKVTAVDERVGAVDRKVEQGQQHLEARVSGVEKNLKDELD